MDFKKITSYFIVILSLALFSCQTQLYVPTKSVNNISVNDLTAGRNLYVNHCGSCHQLYLPKQYSARDWSKNLDEMQVRSKISDVEKRMIYDYLVNQ